MTLNEVAQTVAAQLSEQEEEIVIEEHELARRRKALRRRRSALRARRQAFERCQQTWAKIDERVEADNASSGQNDPPDTTRRLIELQASAAGGD